MSDWPAGGFVADEIATLFARVVGDGGAAMADSLLCEPAGPDCIVFNSKLWAVGTVIGRGCETGNTGPGGIAVADGMSTGEGLGIVICGRAGSGTIVGVAAVGALVRPEASRIVMGGDDGNGAVVPSCAPKTAGMKWAMSNAPANSRTMVTVGIA